MKIDELRLICSNPENYSGDKRKQAFEFCDKARFNTKDKVIYNELYLKLLNWALEQVDISEKNKKFRADK